MDLRGNAVAPNKVTLAIALSLVFFALPPRAYAANATKQPVYEPRSDEIPLSTSVQAGEFLFLAGQVGKKPSDAQADTIEPEARWAMDQIGQTLKHHGLGYN